MIVAHCIFLAVDRLTKCQQKVSKIISSHQSRKCRSNSIYPSTIAQELRSINLEQLANNQMQALTSLCHFSHQPLAKVKK
ncbi:hypothetical protein [Microcystis aeruginosa]|uniref:hypothetical protein n=1 Tax=Microcystis aeruginosa TaxID=1126 RepID=UPI001562C1D9|nr:hypothetical protein [Microcystis aeruginosa]